MPVITLPDGSQRSFDRPVTVADVAASIGAGLARAALAGEVDGRLVDTSFLIDADARLRIITARDPEGLEILRHSTAHLLAQAVQSIYPDAQVTIGPVIDNGFYYDFAYKRPFTPEDLGLFEARMKELAAADLPVHRRVMPREAAAAHFRSIGEHYKAEIIESIPAGEEISHMVEEIVAIYQNYDFKTEIIVAVNGVCYNFMFPNALSADPVKYFHDPNHTYPFVADMMIDAMFNKRVERDTGICIYITRENIEEKIILLRRLFRELDARSK